MKIAKALKLKNQLAGEVAELKEQIQSLQDVLDEFNSTRAVSQCKPQD
jgi:ferritin-like metal-binding protein YciE